MVLFFYQEYSEKRKIKSCQIVTIVYPVKFVPQSNFYYYFVIDGKRTDYEEVMAFSAMGEFERNSTLLEKRFWVKVYCNDYNVNRIYWKLKVPDTLKYIPKNGWKELPYGLDKVSSK